MMMMTMTMTMMTMGDGEKREELFNYEMTFGLGFNCISYFTHILLSRLIHHNYHRHRHHHHHHH